MNILETINDLGKKAKAASIKIRVLNPENKKIAYDFLEKNIKNKSNVILDANKLDIENAIKNNLSKPLINRLKINEDSILGIIKSINQIKNQPDPIGEVLENWEQPNGLKFSKISVPLGVLGVIYESRPNVTIDASCLALKSNNALILRGGSDSFHTSNELVKIITESFEEANLPKNIIQMIPTTNREAVDHLLAMNDYVNVIIPRGGKSLIKKINEKSKIPVIKHLEGLCHVYIDKEADLEIAKKIIFNSKLRRPEICGAAETLLIDNSIKDKAKELIQPLHEAGCKIKGDEYIQTLDHNFEEATVEDWSTEYLDKIISVKIVDGVEGAIDHINNYSSNHTESIITENEQTFSNFYNNIDSAIILKNASTQFADGGEFGFGAEIGISTDKLHVRGPVGAKHLTTFKYIVHGSGQARA
ncbi:MAG: glutamate-5-semialdehyde dehydrogenase [Pelagibacteraceae bacterium]|jgi:glutamate-5-semialdehyde dehydrogenase|nr:glutamate-5-semialdehyde dehydrogenase [Pelagibacteraceae bacterium]MBT3902819.1 glutamate-5-semialdehyde dehydrogenase [Pelagibacteraceae bacterium]MBT4645989.1 glutamate-5-semialdehyde dehydrogenase [Pelagibacteraceae bacterium]MBT4950417.1 glutamate-5-semialdehyde dehydrogenase [Pelagibacteraceae bacterium]MBT5214682.1 glutamate-5-semialdehyde dehydrogenase [Pelagibacteraceae bacterium]